MKKGMNKFCSILLEVKIMLWSKGSKNERKKWCLHANLFTEVVMSDWARSITNKMIWHNHSAFTIIILHFFIWKKRRAKNHKLFCKPRHFLMSNQRYEYRASKYEERNSYLTTALCPFSFTIFFFFLKRTFAALVQVLYTVGW